MRKFIIGLVLAIMAVFSLSAEEYLKKRHVEGSIFDGPAEVLLFSDEVEVGTHYVVAWFEQDGSDIINAYDCDYSIEHAFNVWLMSRDEIESKRQIYDEYVEEIDGNLYLIRNYELK